MNADDKRLVRKFVVLEEKVALERCQELRHKARDAVRVMREEDAEKGLKWIPAVQEFVRAGAEALAEVKRLGLEIRTEHHSRYGGLSSEAVEMPVLQDLSVAYTQETLDRKHKVVDALYDSKEQAIKEASRETQMRIIAEGYPEVKETLDGLRHALLAIVEGDPVT